VIAEKMDAGRLVVYSRPAQIVMSLESKAKGGKEGSLEDGLLGCFFPEQGRKEISMCGMICMRNHLYERRDYHV